MPSMNDSIIYIDKNSPHRSAHLIHLCDKVHPNRMRSDCNVNGRAPVRSALDCNVNGCAPVRSDFNCNVNGRATVRSIIDLFEDSVHANQ